MEQASDAGLCLLADRDEVSGGAELRRVDVVSDETRNYLSGSQAVADLLAKSLRAEASDARVSVRECGVEELMAGLRKRRE